MFRKLLNIYIVLKDYIVHLKIFMEGQNVLLSLSFKYWIFRNFCAVKIDSNASKFKFSSILFDIYKQFCCLRISRTPLLILQLWRFVFFHDLFCLTPCCKDFDLHILDSGGGGEKWQSVISIGKILSNHHGFWKW